jgi:hypothetical protein
MHFINVDLAIKYLNSEQLNDNHRYNDDILCAAISMDKFEVVSLFLKPKNEISYNHSQAIIKAVNINSLKYVNFLLKYKISNPANYMNKSLIDAIKKNNISIVESLLNNSNINPAAYGNEAFVLAYKCNYQQIYKLLFCKKNVREFIKINNIKLHNKLYKRYSQDIIQDKIRVF